MSVPVGLVPLFRRARPEGRKAPATPSPAKSDPAPANARPATKTAGGAHWVTGEEMLRSKRRMLAHAPPRTLAVRKTIADALGLAETCGARGCRRAGRCLGVGGAVCLAGQHERLAPILKALKESSPPEADESPQHATRPGRAPP